MKLAKIKIETVCLTLILINRTEFLGNDGLNTWEYVCLIFGSTLLICVLGLSSYWLFQRRKRVTNERQFIQDDSVCDPILNGNTIQDIIEMTTSGSGSAGLPLLVQVRVMKYLAFDKKNIKNKFNSGQLLDKFN